MKTSTLKSITSALLLGALGSGLWSLAGEPALDWFVGTFISVANHVNEGYYDLLHKEIGSGFHEGHSLFLSTIFSITMLVFFLVLPVVTYKIFKRSKELESDNIKPSKNINERIARVQRYSKLLFVFAVFYVLIASPVYISKIIVSSYNNKAIVFSEKSIEILSPQISQREILRLRALYRSVKDANGFYRFYDEIASKYKEHGVDLPEFEIAR